MTRARTAQRRFIVALCIVLVACAVPPAAARTPRTPAMAQPPTDKSAQTPARQKIDSRLLREVDRRAGVRGLPPRDAGVRLDRRRRTLVDVRVDVTPAMRKRVAALGGAIVSSSAEFHSIVAWV